jgi:hypothetical protein
MEKFGYQAFFSAHRVHARAVRADVLAAKNPRESPRRRHVKKSRRRPMPTARRRRSPGTFLRMAWLANPFAYIAERKTLSTTARR